MPVPGWRLRMSLHASMPSRWKLGGMRMSLTTTFGAADSGPVDKPVVVLRLTDDLEIMVTREHGLDPFADEDAVVGDEDRDCSHVVDSTPHGCRRARARAPWCW